MNKLIDKFKNDKKFRSIITTVIEMILVAGILFAILMYAESKINSEADKTSGLSDIEKNETTTAKITKIYDVEINKANKYITIYQTVDGNRKVIMSFNASIGKNLKEGSYKVNKIKHGWIKKDTWHRYAINFGNSWIYSCNYSYHEPYLLDVSSYANLGSTLNDNNISVCARAAKWLWENMHEDFKVKVIKGRAGDKAPLFQENPKLYTAVGWDPSDPDKDNPYLKKTNGKIVFGCDKIVVERKGEPDYLANVLALDAKGNNINNQLKWKKVSTKKTGVYKIKYFTKGKNIVKLKGTQKLVVQDTLAPRVEVRLRVNKKKKPIPFVYKVKSGKRVDMANEKNVDDIKAMIKKQIATSEKKCKIRIYFPKAKEIRIGTMYAQVRVQDRAGNENNVTVPVKIKIKKPKKKKEKETATDKNGKPIKLDKNGKPIIEQPTTKKIVKKKKPKKKKKKKRKKKKKKKKKNDNTTTDETPQEVESEV